MCHNRESRIISGALENRPSLKGPEVKKNNFLLFMQVIGFCGDLDLIKKVQRYIKRDKPGFVIRVGLPVRDEVFRGLTSSRSGRDDTFGYVGLAKSVYFGL